MADDDVITQNRRGAVPADGSAEPSHRPANVWELLMYWLFTWSSNNDTPAPAPAVEINQPRAEDSGVAARSVMQPAAASSLTNTPAVKPFAAATHQADPALSADGFSWKAVGEMYGFDASALEAIPADVEIEDSEMTNQNGAFGKSWQSAAKALYELKNGEGSWAEHVAEKGWSEQEARVELAEYAEARVGWFNNNFGSLGATWALESDEYKATLMYLVEMNERTSWDASDFGNGAWKMVADLTNYPTAIASLFTFGGAAAAAVAAREAAKAAVKGSATQMLKTGVKVQLAEAAVTAAADSAMRQDIEQNISDDRGNTMSEFSNTRLATDTVIGLGAAIGISGLSYGAGRLARDTGLGDAASHIATKTLDVTGDALGAGLDVMTFRLWRAPGQAIRALRDPSSFNLAGVLQSAQSFGRSVDGSVEIGPRPDGGKSGPKADGDTTAKKDAPEARDANGEASGVDNANAAQDISTQANARGIPKLDLSSQNAFFQNIKQYREQQLALVTTEPPPAPGKKTGWRTEWPVGDYFRITLRAPENARSPRDFHSNMTLAWKELHNSLEAAKGLNNAEFARTKAEALKKFKQTIETLHESLRVLKPKPNKDSIRYLSDYDLAPDALQKLSIYKNLERMKHLADNTMSDDKIGSYSDYSAFVTSTNSRLKEGTGTNQPDSSPLQIQDMLHDAAFRISGNTWNKNALMRDILQGTNAFSGIGMRQTPVGNALNKENIINEDFMKGTISTLPSSDRYLGIMMGRFKKYVDQGLEGSFFESHEEFMLKMGTKPPAEFLSHTDLYQGQIDQLLYEFYTRNPDNPDVLNFVIRYQHEAQTYMANPSGAIDNKTLQTLGFDSHEDGGNLSRRSYRARLAEKMRWLFAYSQFKMDGGNADNFKPIQKDLLNSIPALPWKLTKYVFGPEIDRAATKAARKEKPDAPAVVLDRKYFVDGKGLSSWIWQWKGTYYGIRKPANIFYRASGLDLYNQAIRHLPVEIFGHKASIMFTSQAGMKVMGYGVPTVIGTGALMQAFGDEDWKYTGEQITSLGRILYTPQYLASQYINPVDWAIGTPARLIQYPAGLMGFDGIERGAKYVAEEVAGMSTIPGQILWGNENLSLPTMPWSDGDEEQQVPSNPQGPAVPGVDVARRALIAPELRTYVDSEINKDNPLYVIDTGTFQANHPDFIDDADAQERIFNRTLDLLAAQSSIDISVGANIDAVWTQARAAIQEEDRVAAIKTALVDLLENNNYETAVAEQRVSALLVDQYGKPVENSSILAMFSDKSSSLYNPAFNTPGMGYSIPYSEYQKALAAFNQNQAKLNQKRGEFEARVIAALEGYAADLGVSVSELGPKVKTAAEIIAMVENPPGTFYTEEFLKGPQGKTARALALQEGEKKPSPDTPEEDTTIGGVRVPQSASEAWASAWKGLHEFSDLDNDGKSEISSALYATENVLGGAFNLAGNAFGGKYGKRGEMYAAYGTGLIAALLGTSLIKRVLGIQSWPLVGIIIGAVLFFGTSNFAYAAMTKGGRDTDDGEGDKNGGSQGGNNFIDAAKRSTISRTMLSDGTGVTFNVNIDDDPELEEVSIINRDGNDSAVLQVKDVQNGGKFVATRYLDLKQATRDAQFVATGNTFGIVLDPKQPDRTINFEIIDENGKRKSVITINGQEHKLDMIAESEALLELDKFEPAPQQ